VQAVFLDGGLSPQQVSAIAGFIYGFVGDIGNPIPEFAKQASKLYWRNFLRKGFDPNENVEDAGVVSRLIELATGKPPLEPPTAIEEKVLPAGKPAAEIMDKAARELPAAETAKYYAGRAQAELIWEKLDNPDYLKMNKRASVYVTLAMVWNEFEKLNSQAEAERWLRDKDVIGKKFDSGEVRAVFRLVGLRYGSKPGRPKKIKTDAAIL